MDVEIVLFFLLGLCNNSGYVIMNAGAKTIAPSYVGVIYLCNVLPSFSMKATLPYWYKLASYKLRLRSATVFMASSFLLVGAGQLSSTLGLQFLGIALGSLQGGLGEATFLALSSKFDVDSRRKIITAWSSGTGLAGLFGYGWVFLFEGVMGARFSSTCFASLIIPVIFAVCFETALKKAEEDRDVAFEPLQQQVEESEGVEQPQQQQSTVRRVASLWPYMLPLMSVYFFEYALQSGVWAAIGFPITEKKARDNFYEAANSVYQVGVLLSRSAGTLLHFKYHALALLPFLQGILFTLFWLDAIWMWVYSYVLLLFCLLVGLIGGSIYVGMFALLSEEKEAEFKLTATSLADSVGIILANIVGIYIQHSIYSFHKIHD
eukprot:g3944.t1